MLSTPPPACSSGAELIIGDQGRQVDQPDNLDSRGILGRVRTLARAWFGIDIRSLALFRVGLGLLLLVDLALRSRALTAHYTDAGVLPSWALRGALAEPWRFSIHAISGTTAFQAILFFFAGLFALALMVGWRTRLATALSWLLLISLHNRNPVIIQGGDNLFALLLFWGMFLPLGAAYSVDRALDTSGTEPPRRVVSVASAALLLQIVFVYLFTGLLKSSRDWYIDGSAVYYALSLDYFATPVGAYLLRFPELLRLLTFGTIALEIAGPILALVSVGRVRMAMVAMFIGFHASLWVTMYLGLFPAICIVAWLVFLPPLFWQFLGRRAEAAQAGMIVYYDRHCGFCKKMVLLLRTFLALPHVQFREAQSDASVEADMQARNSWVVVTPDGQRRFKFEGFTAVVAASPVFGWVAPILRWGPIQRIGSHIYTRVAADRSAAGRILTPVRPRPVTWRTPFLMQMAALVLLFMVWRWNVGTVSWLASPPDELRPAMHRLRIDGILGWLASPPDELRPAMHLLRIDQNWVMFSPAPARDDGWFVTVGTRADGSQALLPGIAKGVSSWTKPERVAPTYVMDRWRKYLTNLRGAEYAAHRPYYAQYLCRRWQQGARPPLVSVELYYMQELTLPFGATAVPEKVLVHSESCRL